MVSFNLQLVKMSFSVDRKTFHSLLAEVSHGEAKFGKLSKSCRSQV